MDLSENLQLIAENQIVVYDAGYNKGFNDGKSEGGGEGGDSYYDAFWDACQENGNRTDYTYAFSSASWNDITFKPKYNIQPITPNYMFYSSNITDLKGICDQYNIKLDFSNATNLTNAFCKSKITHVGEIDTRGVKTLTQTFYNSGIVSIEKLVLKDDGSQTFDYTFYYAKNLVDLTIEGVIGKKFSVSQCYNLSKQSIINIMNALSSTTTGQEVWFSLTNIARVFETSEGADDGNNSAEWKALCATKQNWTKCLT